MIISHRVHAFRGQSMLRLDRVLSKEWVVRRTVIRGLIADGRVSQPLGSGVPNERSRLSIVLSGHLRVFFNDGTERVLEAGECLLRPRIDGAMESGAGTTLEFDIGVGDVAERSFGSLSPATRRMIERLADATGGVTEEGLVPYQTVLENALRALRAEGLPLPVRSDLPIDPHGQAYMSALDATLSHLEGAPALVDLEARLGCSRRTIVRRNHTLHSRYGMLGMGRTDFRSIRDFYRLIVASMLLTHPKSTTEGVSATVGYQSPAALCHAFHRLNMPSPSSIRSLCRE